MERKELCIISNSDIPSGSGGINGEGYTYGQLRHQPIITEILRRITHPIARQMAEDCNERNRKDGFTMYKVDGEYCFEGLRVGPKVKIPSKEELLVLRSTHQCSLYPQHHLYAHTRRISTFIRNICTRSCRHHWKPT